jgi:hypothetical protein
MELARMLQHAFPPVRRDDAELDALRLVHVVRVRVVHRPGMERGDLVVVEIGRDERLRGEGVGDPADVALRQAQFLQPVVVGLVIIPHRRHDERLAPQHLEGVGDVAGAAAELAPQVGHEKRDVQDVGCSGRMVLDGRQTP